MFKIMADSTCDLTSDIIEKYNIGIAPLTITIDGIEYTEMKDLTIDRFFELIQNLDKNPTTSMANPLEYLRVFNETLEEGLNKLLCICMSSGTSGSHQSAVIAKKKFFEDNPDSPLEIHIVDSKCMSHGSGYLVLKSALLRERGYSFEEVVEFNETYKKKVKHFLSVDDLVNLIRSGRLSNAGALLGRIFNIKPVMTMRNGKGAIVAKERSMRRVLNHYVREFKRRNNEELTEYIIIGYSSDIERAEKLKQKIFDETDFTGDVYIMQMGLTVSNHVGLGGISMFFFEK